MKEIVIATKNPHKVVEMKHILEDAGYQVFSLFDFDDFPEIIEDGNSFQENALKKAKTLGDFLHKTVIADDSGLEVFALDGAPGIYSARYSGVHKSYQDNNELLLENMKEITNREARFVTSMCIYTENQDPVYIEDYLYGEIAFEAKGDNGFGYDPIFIVKGTKKHLAELTLDEKNIISHRGKCLIRLVRYLTK